MTKNSHSVRMDALRGAAALLVVVGHVRGLTAQDWSESGDHNALSFAFYALTHLGAQAVASFFVLSGYWVGGHVLRSVGRGEFTWVGYLIQRISRLSVVLIPALILTGMAMLCAKQIFKSLALFYDPALSSSIIPAIGSKPWEPITIAGALMFLQPTLTATPALNGPLWTLGLEFWCYLLAPALLLLVMGKKSILSLIIATLAVGMLFTSGPEYPLLWGLGALVARSSRRGVWGGLIPSERIRLAVSGLCLCVAVFVSASPGIPNYASLSIVGVFTADYIATSASSGSDSVDNWPTRLMAWVGTFSYSLYLVHLPVLIMCVSVMYSHFGFSRSGNIYFTIGMNLAGAVSAVLAAWAFYSLFEARTDALRKYLTRRVGRKSSTRLP